MKNWFTVRKALIAFVLLALLGGAGAWSWHAQNDSRMSLRTALVKRGGLVATISATGTIEPVEVVDIGAQVAGRISAFGVDMDGKTIDYGSVVQEGALLAQIDESATAGIVFGCYPAWKASRLDPIEALRYE